MESRDEDQGNSGQISKDEDEKKEIKNEPAKSSTNDDELISIKGIKIPKSLYDEIYDDYTGSVYKRPVVAPDGNTYERKFIIDWAKKNNGLTPTRHNAKGQRIYPNRGLIKKISDAIRKYPELKDELYDEEDGKQYRESYGLGELSNISINEKNKRENQAARVNEASPLIAVSRSQRSCLCFILSGVCIGIIVVGGIIALAVIIEKNRGVPVVFYEFKTPYAGGGTITVRNDWKYYIYIRDISFSVNSVINTQNPGSIYGDLAPWGESIIELVKTDGDQFYYKITEDQSILLEAGSHKDFTYVFSSSKGTLNVTTLPQNVQITTSNDEYPLKLYGKCLSENDCPDPLPGKSLGGYYTNWEMYNRKYNVNDLPTDKINFVNYGPLMPDMYGNLALHDPNADNIQIPMLMQMTYKYRYLKVSLSIGGYGPPCSAFTSLAANATSRQNFANKVTGAIQQFKFHGVDIDWEYPGKDDAMNFIELLKIVRATLGNNYRITIAAPAGSDRINAIGNLWLNATQYVDAINVRFYDYNGPWSTYSDYQSPMNLPPNDPNGVTYSIKYTLGLYAQYGVPNNKIIFGIPTYYRGVLVSSTNQYGLWQKVNGTPQGQFDQMGTFDYACVVGNNCYAGSSFPTTCLFLDQDISPYGNFSRTPMASCPQIYLDERNAIFTGESVKSIEYKTCFTTLNNFKGIFFWTLSGDVRNDPSKSLVSTAYNSIKTPCANNSTSTEINNQLFFVQDEDSWQRFTALVKQTVLSSFFGGMAFTFVFVAVDKLTDTLLQSLFNKVHFKQAEYNLAAYYSIKTALYLGTLYYLGMPLLPVAAGKVVSNYLHHLCKIPVTASAVGGGVASFFANLNWELVSSESFMFALINFVSSMLGGLTPAGLFYCSEKVKPRQVFGFFKGLSSRVTEMATNFRGGEKEIFAPS